MSHVHRIEIERPDLPALFMASARGNIDVAAMVEDIADSLADFQGKQGKRLDDIEASVDDVAKRVGRFVAGAGGGLDGGERSAEATTAGRFFAAVKGHPLDRADEVTDAEGFRDYRAALSAYLRKGRDSLSGEVLNTLSVGSDPAGGFTVMPDRRGEIVSRNYPVTPMRELATVEEITIGDAREDLYDKDEADAGWVGETETRSDTDTPDLGGWRIELAEQYAQPVATQKLLDDSSINIEQWLIGKVERKFARTEGAAFVTGNGIKKPLGFLANASTAATTEDDDVRAWGKLQYVPAGASGGFPIRSGLNATDADALVTLVSKLDPVYRANAVWVMNRASAAVIQTLTDNYGRYIWRDSLEAGKPATLLGYPVRDDFEDMPDIAADTFSIAFGDFRAGYRIIERPGFRVLRDPFTTKGKVKFYCTRRVGGGVVNWDAIKLLKFSAA